MSINPRQSFLIEFYRNMWLNIRRAETSLWILCSIFFSISVGLMAYLYDMNREITIFIIILISFSFSIITFNFNLWYVRNLRLVSRIEKEFFNDSDYENIIPKKWIKNNRGFFNKEPYCILGIIYPIVGIILFLITYSPFNYITFKIIFLISEIIILLLVEVFYLHDMNKSYNNLLKSIG